MRRGGMKIIRNDTDLDPGKIFPRQFCPVADHSAVLTNPEPKIRRRIFPLGLSNRDCTIQLELTGKTVSAKGTAAHSHGFDIPFDAIDPMGHADSAAEKIQPELLPVGRIRIFCSVGRTDSVKGTIAFIQFELLPITLLSPGRQTAVSEHHYKICPINDLAALFFIR